MSFSKNKMLVMPAVDIRNGKCVQLVQGKPGSEQVIIENPEEVAKNWEQIGANIIHVIDLDGALGSEDNLWTIKKIRKDVGVPIQMGGGIRNYEYAERLLELGIDRVIIGTMAIEHPEIISKLSQEYGSDRIMVSLDSKDSKVVIKGWTEKISQSADEIANMFKEKGAGSVLFTNVDYEGLLNGFNIEPVNKLINSTDMPIVYAGGISSTDDLKILRDETQVQGVVIGSALYKKTINLKDALQYQTRSQL